MSIGGCFNCEGDHFGRDCTANKGGKPVGKGIGTNNVDGKGKNKGINSIESE